MTTYVLSKNTGVFKCGIAVAPVTDWRYYGKQARRVFKCRCGFAQLVAISYSSNYFSELLMLRFSLYRALHGPSSKKSKGIQGNLLK